MDEDPFGFAQGRLLVAQFFIFQIRQQLLLKVTTRGFFDRAALLRDRFLLYLPFLARTRVGGPRQMRDLRSVRANSSLIGLCVRIHAENRRIRHSTFLSSSER